MNVMEWLSELEDAARGNPITTEENLSSMMAGVAAAALSIAEIQGFPAAVTMMRNCAMQQRYHTAEVKENNKTVAILKAFHAGERE